MNFSCSIFFCELRKSNSLKKQKAVCRTSQPVRNSAISLFTDININVDTSPITTAGQPKSAASLERAAPRRRREKSRRAGGSFNRFAKKLLATERCVLSNGLYKCGTSLKRLALRAQATPQTLVVFPESQRRANEKISKDI